MADSGNDRVVRLASGITNAYDVATDSGSHVIATGFDNPYSVSVNSTEGSVWVADYGNDEVVKLDSDGTEVARVSGFYYPIAVAVNPRDGAVWVADYYHSEVVKLASDGTRIVRLGGFSYPRAVAVADSGAGNFYSSAAGGSTSHTYTHPGSYRAIFTVTDNNGQTAKKAVDITVRGVPEVTLTSNVNGGPAPLEVFFSATVNDLDGAVRSYAWDFDGDGTVDEASETSANARHVYPSAGTFEAILQVTDDDGYSSSDSVTIIVTQNPPTAKAGAAPMRGNAPLTVNFSGSGSDPDGTIVLYEWDFESDGTYDFSSATTPETTHAYNAPGLYTATLRVTDDSDLSKTDSVSVQVFAAGKPSALLSAAPTLGTSPFEVLFCAYGMDPDGTITKVELDFEGSGAYQSILAHGFRRQDGRR